MDMIFGIVITLFMGVFAFYSCVIVEEERRGEWKGIDADEGD